MEFNVFHNYRDAEARVALFEDDLYFMDAPFGLVRPQLPDQPGVFHRVAITAYLPQRRFAQ